MAWPCVLSFLIMVIWLVIR